MKFYRFILSRKFLFVVNFFCVLISVASLSISIKIGKDFYRSKEQIVNSNTENTTEQTAEEGSALKEIPQKEESDVNNSKNVAEVNNYNSEYIKLLEKKHSEKKNSNDREKTKKIKNNTKESEKKSSAKKEKKTTAKKEKNTSSGKGGKKYNIQVASFESKAKAKAFIKGHSDSKKLEIIKNNSKHQVVIKEKFQNEKEAQKFAKKHSLGRVLIKEINAKK